MSSLGYSQITLPQERIQFSVNTVGDTIISMTYADGKRVLTDLLQYKSLLDEVSLLDKKITTYLEIIDLKNTEITILHEKESNHTKIINNLNNIIRNKDEQIDTFGNIVDKQTKSIKILKLKQKIGVVAIGVTIIGILILSK